MGNVWEAMKKHLAEKQQDSPPPGEAPAHAHDERPAGAAAVKPLPEAPRRETRAAAPARVQAAGGAAYKYSEVLVAHHDRGSQLSEEYRALRTSLLAQNPDDRLCYMVTSGDPAEGKTVTTANLGIVLAEQVERQTVLVDFDLRKGSLCRLLNASVKPGLVEHLRGQATLEQIIQPTAYPNLWFIPTGEMASDQAGEISGHHRLGEFVDHLRRRFDSILFDTPPINLVSDAGMLGRVIRDAIVVVRMNRTVRDSAEKAIRLLTAANINVAGVVLTHRRRGFAGYRYRYSRYRYYS